MKGTKRRKSEARIVSVEPPIRKAVAYVGSLVDVVVKSL
jgi:hypothetical protein